MTTENRSEDTTVTDREPTSSVNLTPAEREQAANIARTPQGQIIGDDLILISAEQQKFIAEGGDANDFQASNSAVQTQGDRILVQAVAKDDINLLVKDLEKLGVEDISSYGKVAAGFIQISQLANLSGLATIQFAQPAYKGFTRAGKVTSQGDKAMQSDVAKTDFEVDGSGIKIGVMSDSYDNLKGADADVTSGDLPDSVTVLKDIESGGSDEGRAMAQIVHDVAPGADLFFRTAFISAVDFANGIGELVSAGADIIVDDVAYFEQPFFQDGIIAQAASDAATSGVAYFSSAGNSGTDSYESAFNPGNNYPVGFFSGAFYGGVAHQFDEKGDELQEFILESGESILLSFQWNDPFISAGSTGASRDLDIYVLNAAGTEILASSANQNVGKDAVEVLSFVNDTETTGTYNLMIVDNTTIDGDQTAPTLIKYIDFNGDTEFTEYTTDSPTVFGHPNGQGVAGVGAAKYQETPAFGQNPPLLEDFSSVGGISIYFDRDGQVLAEPIIRQTPLIVAPDGVDTTFFGSPDSDQSGFPEFFGTSAAAPHAAAVAALMLQAAEKKLTSQEIYDALANTAIDMESDGFDVKSGYGLINAKEAIFAVKPDITLTGDDDNKVVEGLSSEYQIKLNTQPSADVTINFQVDTNKISQISPVTFTPDNWNNEQTISFSAIQVTGNDATVIKPIVTSTDTQYSGVTLDDFIVTIIDNESPGVSIYRSNGSNDISEEGATDTFQIVLNKAPAPNSEVKINIAFDSTQVNLDQETVTFTSENWNQKQVVSITAVNDNIAEGDHNSNINFQVTPDPDPDSDSTYQGIEIEPLIVNIIDNDFAGVTVQLNADEKTVDVTESGLVTNYQIRLNSQPKQNVTIDLTKDGQIELLNGENVLNSLTFTPNNWDVFQTVAVKAIDDETEEGLHTSLINYTINTTSSPDYLDVKIPETKVNIVDNETFGITVIPVENLTVIENGENGEDSATYKVIVNKEPSTNVNLTLTPLLENQGLEPDQTNLTFSPSNWNQFKTVTVTAVDDDIARGDRTEEIKYTINPNSAPEYRTISVNPVKIDVKDDDKIGLEVSGKVAVSEAGTTGTYTLNLKSQPSENVFIEVVTDDQLQSIIPLTFTPENWTTPQTVTVKAMDDNLVEDTPHLSVIKHFARSESATEYLALSQTNLSVEITDNDQPGVIIEETEGNTTVIKGKAIDTYLMYLNSQPESDVTVNITTDNQLQSITSVTFTRQNWNQPQTITVIPVNDNLTAITQSVIQHEVSSDSDSAFVNTLIDDVTVKIQNDPNAGLFPNNKDNNKDGILDSEQSNVYSILTTENSTNPNDVFTVVSPKNSLLNTVEFLPNPGTESTTNPENNGVNFPLDFLNLQVINFQEEAGLISLLLPNSADDQDFNTYWTYQPTISNNRDHWESFISQSGKGAKFFDTDNNGNPDLVLLHVIDGQNGDGDLTKNNTIVHQGAPGVVNNDVTLTRGSDKVFQLNSANQQAAYLDFTRVSTNSNDTTEVGVFVVDSENKVNGVAPTDGNFLDQALNSATVIFSSLNRNSNGEVQGMDLNRQLQYASGDRLAFYIIKNDTTDTFQQGGGNPNNVFFSITEANPDSFDHVKINNISDNQFDLSWETSTAGLDLSFDDLVMTVQLQDTAPQLEQLIANYQGQTEGELIDLSNVPGEKVQANFEIIRSEASYNNHGGLYKIEDAQGTVVDPLTGQKLTPGQSGYAQAAVRQSQQSENGASFSARSGGGITAILDGHSLYAPFLIANGTPDQLLDSNSGNDPQVYFAFTQGNRDGVDHVRLLGDNSFGFEDFANGGDRDYDDLIFQVKFEVV